jgi:hypothetical protein
MKAPGSSETSQTYSLDCEINPITLEIYAYALYGQTSVFIAINKPFTISSQLYLEFHFLFHRKHVVSHLQYQLFNTV